MTIGNEKLLPHTHWTPAGWKKISADIESAKGVIESIHKRAARRLDEAQQDKKAEPVNGEVKK